jgi:hypothetical protein
LAIRQNLTQFYRKQGNNSFNNSSIHTHSIDFMILNLNKDKTRMKNPGSLNFDKQIIYLDKNSSDSVKTPGLLPDFRPSNADFCIFYYIPDKY